MNITLILLLVSTITSAVISFVNSDKIIQDIDVLTPKPIFRQPKRMRLTRKGKILIISFATSIIFTISQFFIDQSEKQERANAIDNQRKLDSIKDARNAMELAEHIANIKNETIEKLAQYGLKYDTASQRIEKLIKDSVKRNTTIIASVDPTFKICNLGLEFKRDSANALDLDVKYCNEDATSKKLNMSLYLIIEYNYGNRQFAGVINHLPKNFQMSKGDIATFPISIPYNYQISAVYFLLRGNYTNSDESKPFTVDLVYIYDVQERQLKIPVLEREAMIRGYFRILGNIG